MVHLIAKNSKINKNVFESDLLVSVYCMGASQEVGRSAFLLNTDKTLLLDYGIKIFGKNGEAEFPLDFNEKALDAVIISHAHMDHIGFLPNLYNFSKTRWIGTPPTHDLAEILLADSMKIMGEKLPFDQSHYKKALKYWIPAVYNHPMQVGKTEIRLFDAGHIAGSVMVELNYEGRKILYSGDIKLNPMRMHDGLKYEEEVDVLFIESTYSNREHPERKEIEEQLMEEIEETTEEGGTVLLPSFALGRTQELIRVIRAHNKEVPIFVDGMGRKITGIYTKYGDYIKEVNGFRKEVKTVTMVGEREDRYAAVEGGGVIISSAGMLEGGPALWYMLNLNKKSKIIFTGYCVEGTNGWRLLNEGKVVIDGNELEVELPVGYLDFSAHAGRSEVLEFIKRTNPEQIVTIHGDSTKEFADELTKDFGFDAVAPKVGETIEI